MSKAEKIKAEIDRLQETTMDENRNFLSSYYQGVFDGLSLIDNFIDSIEEEPVSNDLEEAAKNYEEDAIFYAARRISDYFKAGAQWQKEQMIKKACDWLRKGGSGWYLTSEFGEDEINFVKLAEDFKKVMEE